MAPLWSWPSRLESLRLHVPTILTNSKYPDLPMLDRSAALELSWMLKLLTDQGNLCLNGKSLFDRVISIPTLRSI